MYKIMILLINFSYETTLPLFTKFHVDPSVETGESLVPLTVMPIYGTNIKHVLLENQAAQMMIISLLAMTGLGKCIISA